MCLLAGFFESLAEPKNFPLNILKIARSYVNGLSYDAEDKAIIHATVTFAKALDLSVIAKGIENAEKLTRLREFGC